MKTTSYTFSLNTLTYCIIGFLLCTTLKIQAQQVSLLGTGVGTNGIVNCIEYDSINNITYVGGYFQSINGTIAKSIAFYDGVAWHTMGTGIANGSVYSIKKLGNNIYVGGYFQDAGGLAVNNMAMWDGTSWHDVGQGVAGYIKYMEIYNNKLFVSGYITGAGGNNNLKYVVVWDGSAWQSSGLTIDRDPINIKKLNDSLYVFGGLIYDSIQQYYLQKILRYDGTSWQVMPNPDSSYYVEDMSFHNNKLYAIYGGSIGYWNGASWDTVYTGNYTIDKFALFNNDLYVLSDTSAGAGNMDQLLLRKFQNNTLTQTIAQTSYNSFYQTSYNVITQINSSLVIGGSFTNLNGDLTALSLSSFDGIQWKGQNVCAGSYVDAWNNCDVLTSCYDSLTGNLYVGGHFYFAGDSVALNVARWDGTSWHPMGNGLSDYVYKLQMYNGVLYAAGSFKNSGNTTVNYFSRWNGVNWLPVGNGASAVTRDMLVYNNELYIAGNFTSFDAVGANYIAKFNGVNFSSVGNNALDETTFQIELFNNTIVAGTRSYTPYFNTSNAAMLVNGNWVSMGIQPTPVYDFHVKNGILYASGTDWPLPPPVSFWNGSAWDTIPTTPYPGDFPKLFEIKNDLYLGDLNSGLFKFNGTSWDFLSRDFMVFTISQIDSNSFYLGGFIPFYYQAPLQPPVYTNDVCKLDYIMPQAIISASSDTICEHQYVYFQAQSNDIFMTYEWHLQGVIPDTSNQANPIAQYLTPGTYTAYVIVKNLVGTDTIYLQHPIVVKSCTVGEEAVFENSSVLIKPNPFLNDITILTKGEIVISATVLDINGREIYNVFNTAGENAINIACKDLNKGVFILKLRTKNKIITRKIIKQ